MARSYDRSIYEHRPVTVTYNIYDYAPGSVLFQIGTTKVLCAVTFQSGVPPFLRNSKEGWLTAEYALLPAATHQRTQRESHAAQRNGRSVEISRFIGRCLRTVIDRKALGENTLHIDCDVLNADGGTRAAAITGACLALHAAQEVLLQKNLIISPFITQSIAALSVGIIDEQLHVDLDYAEDSRAQADFNVVMTRTGELIEIQGGAETKPLRFDTFSILCQVASTSLQELCNQVYGVESFSYATHRGVEMYSK